MRGFQRYTEEMITFEKSDYKYAFSYEDLYSTLDHLRERRDSLSFTLPKLQTSFTQQLQTDLFKT